ncbi:hypothetical protein RI129_007648 [Pyrocoelia pectoralis]|uniref:15-hydroxyprostaglandin dehydrogenase [NAD(+)]-like n=1 Tax=Pyrocoelia pectoralis TaxID=417401 RepID=A0AAN7VEI1_9COLE
MQYINLLFLLLALSVKYSLLTTREFDFKDKIALVTGGAEGIGLQAISELLQNGVKGVTLVDINANKGQEATKALNEKFGKSKVIFVHADISSEQQFEDAFKTSINHWKVLDIVINNAAFVDENNWRMIINVNAVGTLQGTFLGLKYMSKNMGGRGGVILNMSSIVGIIPAPIFPVYSATKSFVLSFGRSLGDQVHYGYNEVRILTLCPGLTRTGGSVDIANLTSNTFNPHIIEIAAEFITNAVMQSASNVANAVVHVLRTGPNGSVWIVKDGEPPFQIDFPGNGSSQKINNR